MWVKAESFEELEALPDDHVVKVAGGPPGTINLWRLMKFPDGTPIINGVWDLGLDVFIATPFGVPDGDRVAGMETYQAVIDKRSEIARNIGSH